MFLFLTDKNFYTTKHQHAGDFTSQDHVSRKRGLIALIADSHWVLWNSHTTTDVNNLVYACWKVLWY